MKKIGMSMVAVAAIVASVHATSDMNVSGHVKLWYQTMDHEGVEDEGLFIYDKKNGNEWGDLAAQLKVTGTFNDHIAYGATLNGITSLGLENHVVGAETTRNNWTTNSGGVNGTSAQPFWFHEVYVAYKAGNTVAKVGRQELDTPLAYTENWNATSNSFEAAVLVNSDVPDTTLVGAWVSKGNGATRNIIAAPQVFGAETQFNSYMGYNQDLDADGKPDVVTRGGALAFGAVNKSISFLPLQAWYYIVSDVAQAWWLQADAKMENVGPMKKAGLQLIGAGIGTAGKVKDILDAAGSDTADTIAFAAKVDATAGMFDAFAAFSQTSEGNIPVANTATNYKKTKLPTASIFSDGMVAAQPGTTAFLVGAGAKFDGIGALKVTYGGYTVGENEGYLQPNANIGGPASFGYIANKRGEDMDISEIDVVFNTKIQDVALAIMYINVDKTYVPGGADYGDYANQIVRAIATLSF